MFLLIEQSNNQITTFVANKSNHKTDHSIKTEHLAGFGQMLLTQLRGVTSYMQPFYIRPH